MFHLEFQQNQTNSNRELHEAIVAKEGKQCENKKEVPRKPETECDQIPEYEPKISTESSKDKPSAKKMDEPVSHHPFIYE